MTRRTLLILWALGALPLVVPLLVCLPMMLFEVYRHNDIIFLIFSVSAWSLLYGGVPYLLFYLYYGFWMRCRRLQDVIQRMKFAPFYFIPCQLVYLLILVRPWYGSGDSFYVYLFMGVLSTTLILNLGYLYVGIALKIIEHLRKRHVIADKAD